ncbi:MAG: hypothetical protein M1482_00205 [Chloroflexi bacterium]|nr:hypothetical protein [Chloroflexota bacterium]
MTYELELALSNTRQWIERKLQDGRGIDARLVRRRYLPELFAFSDWRGKRPLSKEIVDEYVDLLLRSGYSALSVRRTVKSIRWLLERLQEIESPDTPNVRAVRLEISDLVHSLRRQPIRTAIRPGQERLSSPSDLRAIMQVCTEDASSRGARDGAIAGLLWATGIGHSALARLTLFDVRANGNIANAITVRRSGRRDRTVELPPLASDFLSKWLKARGRNLGPLFYAAMPNGRIQWGQSLTESSVGDILRQRLDEHKSRIGPI